MASKGTPGKGELTDRVQEYMSKGQWKKALSELEKLYALDRNDPMVTLWMGDVCLKVGDKDRAATNYVATAQQFAKQGHIPKALATCKMILRLDPSIPGVKELMDELAGGGAPQKTLKVDLSKAIPGLETAARNAPEPPPVREPDNAPVYELDTKGAGGGAAFDFDSYGTLDLSSTEEPDEGVTGFTTGSFGNELELPASDETGDIEIRETPPEETTMPEKTTVEEPQAQHPTPPATAQAPASESSGQKTVAFLFDLSHEEMWDLLGRMKRRAFEAGDVIVREGEIGDALYIIRSGAVQVTTKVGDKEIPLAKLGERDFFGEVSLLTGRPRTADIVAVDKTEVMELSRNDLDAVMKKHPKVEGVLKLFHESRVTDTVTTLKAVAKDFFK